MKVIEQNPYRILGLLAGASTREISKQTNRLKKIIGADMVPPTDDFSFPFLGKLSRATENIEEASSKLNLDNDKMKAALFWFWNGNPITDEVAFEELKAGNVEEAYQIWDKLVTRIDENNKRYWNEVSARNFSAFHNRSVLSLITDKVSFVSGVIANIKFIESDYFDKFIESTVDVTYKAVKKDIELDFLSEIANSIDIQKHTSLIKYLRNFDFLAKSTFLKNLSQKYTGNISTQIETARKKSTANKSNAAKIGEELYQQTKLDLDQLKLVVGAEDYTYTNFADKVANEILQCSINFFNYHQEIDSSNDYQNVTMQLAKLADEIAVGSLVKGRIKENIATLEEMKDREILKAIELLKSVKEAYERACRKIDEQVDELQYYTFPNSGGGQPRRTLRYDVSINWSKVEEMKRNALAWDKVVDLVKQAIPPQNIEKIKALQNQAKVSEYKNLVNFLMGKISSWGKREIQYLDYWSPQMPTSSGGCYIATMVYGSYEHPQVFFLRQFRDDVLDKSVLGRQFVKFYYQYSPKLAEVLKDKQFINNSIRNILNQFIKLIK